MTADTVQRPPATRKVVGDTSEVDAVDKPGQNEEVRPSEIGAARRQEPQEKERPPQQDELLCTICHMPSCWR